MTNMKGYKMISKVGAGNSAYLQSSQDIKDSKGVEPANKTKELDKVGALKEQIQNNDYKIDIDKTAKSVVEELI